MALFDRMSGESFKECSDPNFVIRAMADYAKEKARIWSEWRALCASAATAETLDEVDALLSESEDFLPESWIPSPNGYVSAQQALRDIFAAYDSAEAFTDPTYVAGFLSQDPLTTPAEYGDFLEDTYQSVLSLAEACAAKAGDAVDQGSQYLDSLKFSLKDPFTDSSSTIQYYYGLLKDSVQPDQFLEAISKDTGLDAMADDASVTASMNTLTDITGASPVAALSCDLSAVGAVINAGAKVAKSIFKAAGKLAKRLFKKVKAKLKAITTNPIDLKVCNKDAESYIVNGYCNSVHETSLYFAANLMGDVDKQECARRLDIGLRKMVGHAYSTESLFAVSRFKVDRIDGYTFSSDKIVFAGEFTYQVQPRCLNPDAVVPVVLSWSAGAVAEEVASEQLAKLRTTPGLYLDPTDTNESKCLFGFGLANAMEMALVNYNGSNPWTKDPSTILSATCVALRDCVYGISDSDQWALVSTDAAGSAYRAINATDATNLGFATIVSSMAANGTYPDRYLSYTDAAFQKPRVTACSRAGYAAYYNNADPVIVGDYFALVAANMYEKITYPLDYGFFPYIVDNTETSAPRFEIPTDSYNNSAFEEFIKGVIVLVAVVALAIVVKVGTKKLQRKKFFKFKQRQSELQAKMNSGQPLTAKEQRQFIRATKKTNASKIFTKGATTSASSESTSDTSPDVYSVIVGTVEDDTP